MSSANLYSGDLRYAPVGSRGKASGQGSSATEDVSEQYCAVDLTDFLVLSDISSITSY